MADIMSIQLPSAVSTANASSNDIKKVQSYLYQLTEQLRYVLSNLDSENMSDGYNGATSQTATQIASLSVRQAENTEALQQKITTVTKETEQNLSASSETLNRALECLQAQVMQRVAVANKENEQGLGAAVIDTIQMMTQLSDDLLDMVNRWAQWVNMTENALVFAQAEGATTDNIVPYHVQMDAHGLSLGYYGQSIAQVGDNGFYIERASVADKISLGGRAGEGTYDFVTTATGLGIRWREG